MGLLVTALSKETYFSTSANYFFTNFNLDDDQFYCGKCDSFYSNEVDYANHLNQHTQALKRKAPIAPQGDFFVKSFNFFVKLEIESDLKF